MGRSGLGWDTETESLSYSTTLSCVVRRGDETIHVVSNFSAYIFNLAYWQQKPEKRSRRKELSIKKAAAEMTPSQSYAEIHMPSEEEASTMYAISALNFLLNTHIMRNNRLILLSL